MAKQKLTVEEVFILEEVIPYDGSMILGVYTTKTLAQQARPNVKRWYDGPSQSETVSQSRSLDTDSFENFFTISSYPVQGGKT